MWKAKRGNKYNAKKTEYNGVLYDSKKEARYAETLDMLRKASRPEARVISVDRQVPLEFKVNNKLMFRYFADFFVIYASGREEWVDAKGVRTPVYKLKVKIIQEHYGIRIKEV